MEKGFRLLERIERGEPKVSYEHVVDSHVLIQSIQKHLIELFNTHTGNSTAATEYGLPDFNDVLSNSENIVKDLQDNIQQTINTFEPRLINTQVFYKPSPNNPLELSFGIQGEINHNDEVKPISLDIYLDTDGQFNRK